MNQDKICNYIGGVLIGTVPYHENLLINQVIYPGCGKIFH